MEPHALGICVSISYELPFPICAWTVAYRLSHPPYILPFPWRRIMGFLQPCRMEAISAWWIGKEKEHSLDRLRDIREEVGLKGE